MRPSYEGQQLSQTINVTGLLNGQSITTMQQPFLLSEADFLRLKGKPPITASFSFMIFGGIIGYAIPLAPKLTLPLKNNPITAGEIWTIIIGILIATLIYGVGSLFPNDQKKTIKRISKHFEDAPVSSHIVGIQE